MPEKCSKEQVEQNIIRVKNQIITAAESVGRNPNDVTLLAATKTVDPDTINFAISHGIRCIGENRVQELLEKYDSIDRANVDMHFIGRLQTNKVKYIIDKVSMIHSVDSLKLANEINRQAQKHDKRMDVLIEVNIGSEESKGGVEADNAESFAYELSKLENIRVCGLMAIPPVCVPENAVQNANMSECDDNAKKFYKNREFFKKIMQLFLDISAKKIDNIYVRELSMGMSDDFECAVQEGATIVRLGRTIFGSR